MIVDPAGTVLFVSSDAADYIILIQINLCVMDTFWTNRKSPDYQEILIFQVSLYDIYHYLKP